MSAALVRPLQLIYSKEIKSEFFMYRQSPIIRWRKYEEQYQLIGNKCINCNSAFYPKKELCLCGNNAFIKLQFSGEGQLLSFTEIKSAPEEYAFAVPYCLGIIQLKEGPKILAQITDCNGTDLKIGTKVQAAFRKYYKVNDAGIIHYGIKFIPLPKNDDNSNDPIRNNDEMSYKETGE